MFAHCRAITSTLYFRVIFTLPPVSVNCVFTFTLDCPASGLNNAPSTIKQKVAADFHMRELVPLFKSCSASTGLSNLATSEKSSHILEEQTIYIYINTVDGRCDLFPFYQATGKNIFNFRVKRRSPSLNRVAVNPNHNNWILIKTTETFHLSRFTWPLRFPSRPELSRSTAALLLLRGRNGPVVRRCHPLRRLQLAAAAAVATAAPATTTATRRRKDRCRQQLRHRLRQGSSSCLITDLSHSFYFRKENGCQMQC